MKQTYISLLRGINVGGHKKILMKDLHALYQECNFTNIKTYIQSGNVVFEHDAPISSEALAQKIAQKIMDKYHFDVSVFVKTAADFEAINTLFPFLDTPDLKPNKIFVTLLSDSPLDKNTASLQNIDLAPDKYVIFKNVVFWYAQQGHESKLSNNFFENKLKVIGTTRNWTTMLNLVAIAHDKKTSNL
jgi:uncharacterized protein (DUF1697 family)